jgi:hypothetical protein
MNTRSGAGQTAAKVGHDRLESGFKAAADRATGEISQHKTGSQKMVAAFLNPGCEHDWCKLANDLQTLASEGKTIWQCRGCSEITNTYDWKTP